MASALVNAAARAAKAASGPVAPVLRSFRAPPKENAPLVTVPNPAFSLGRMMAAGAPVPDRSALPALPRLYVKKPRLHPYWKLHPVRKWRDFAPLITKAVFMYDPSTEGSGGIRELLRHANGTKMKGAFPKCTVEGVMVQDGREATLSITWTSGKSQTAVAQWCDFEDILENFEPARQALQWSAEDLEMN